MNDQAKNIEMNFTMFISGLLAEGLATLGAIQHPSLKGVKKDLKHTSFVIDTMEMLKNKTSGNLDKRESDNIDAAIHQLRMMYVAEINNGEDGAKDTDQVSEGDV